MVIGGWRGPGWRVVDASPLNCGETRRWVTAAVSRHGCAVGADDVASVVTEMFSNAVLHGPAGSGYSSATACGGVACVSRSVTAADPERLGSAWPVSGRGLRIVDAVAVRWGHFRVDAAQVVWCDLGEPLRVPVSDAWAWLRLVLSADSLSAPARPPVTVSAW